MAPHASPGANHGGDFLCLSRYREMGLCASPSADPDVEVTCYASPGTVRWLPVPLQVPILVLR